MRKCAKLIFFFFTKQTQKTELGNKAKEYIDKGELVPDEITVPMILNRMKQMDCNNGWLLDGFPRSPAQAQALWNALQKEGVHIDTIIEIVLERSIVKKRILGRRVCEKDGNHPNNVAVEAIMPIHKEGVGDVCRVCESRLSQRADDIDEGAVDKRHDIYYNETTGTLGAIKVFRDKAKVIQIDGTPSVKEISENLRKQLKL